MNYTEIKSFEDACKVEGLDPEKILPDFACYPEQDRKAMTAHAKLVIIARAVNRLANGGQEWKPDFTNWNQYKYQPWLHIPRGSSGFRFVGYVCWATSSGVGSRLCFISREVAKYVVEQFEDLYNEYFL